MRKRWAALGVILVVVPAAALEFSGALFTGFSWEGTSFTGWNSLSLRLSFPNFGLETISTWQGLTLTGQTLTLTWASGSLEVEAGLAFKPVSPPHWASWSFQELAVVASFISLNLDLGNLRLCVTIQAK